LLTHEFLAVKSQEQLDVESKVPELAPFSAVRIGKLNLEILVDIPCVDNDGGCLNHFLARAALSFDGHVASLFAPVASPDVADSPSWLPVCPGIVGFSQPPILSIALFRSFVVALLI
jgi:hypothetical protein